MGTLSSQLLCGQLEPNPTGELTHAAESSHFGDKGAGQFLHKLFSVISPGRLGLRQYVNASVIPHQAGKRADVHRSGEETGVGPHCACSSPTARTHRGRV